MRYIGNVEKDGQVRAVASGALSTGDTVIVNSDGTVSVVEGGVSVSQTTTFEGSDVTDVAATYDSTSEVIVVAYKEGSTSEGTAVVGTISGGSITFGTPVVFESGSVDSITATYNSAQNKTLISYRTNFNGYAIVGTVSGTSISFGGRSIFVSSGGQQQAAAYDSNSGVVVIAYRDETATDGGSARVATISGTSVSFGTAVQYEAGDTRDQSATFDSSTNQVVIVYRDQDNSGFGTAVVGSVSGTSISFGTPVVFKSVLTIDKVVSYNSTANRILVVYEERNTNEGVAAVGTVSGTSISFGTEVVFSPSGEFSDNYSAVSSGSNVHITYDAVGVAKTVSASISGDSVSFDSPSTIFTGTNIDRSLVFDPNAGLFADFFREGTSGTAVLFSSGSNLTTENFLGFAAHTYADTQSAVINSTCTVDRNQSGLTAGQKYYVQTDGTLSTTAGSVEAGTAISSTEIIVKG